MKTVVRNAVLLAAGLLGSLLLLVGPAHAGGPTSVLLVAPGSDATALYYSDPQYDRLTGLVGAEPGTAGRVDENPHAEGPFITVTWLIHDVHVWRVDRIYYGAEGGPWIHTDYDALDDDMAGQWHTSERPEALGSLLKKLGLTGGEEIGGPTLAPRNEPVSQDESEQAAAQAASESPRAESAVTGGSNDGAPGWWWAGGGLVAGAVLTGTAARWRSDSRSNPGPRQQLIDT